MSDQDRLSAINSGKTVSWQLGSITDDTYSNVRKEFSSILDLLKRTDLKVQLDYCLREFCVNSQKAMIKRLYFKTHHADIDNPEDYERMIAGFREAWTKYLDVWERRLQESEQFYQVNVQCKDGFLNLFVVNPGKVHPVEQQRIKEQIHSVTHPSEDGFDFGIGDAEGGGLGLLLIGRMIQTLGGGANNLGFWVYEDKTVFMLRVPLDRHEITGHKIHAALAKAIDNIPSFPETLIELQKQINQPDLMIPEIAEMVKRDAGLAALILKTANSAAFVRLKQVTDLTEAISYIGLKGLKALLLYHGMEKQFSKGYSGFKEVMEHSHHIASIAGKLAKKYLPKQVETAYVGGLLHDMGKIVMLEHPSALAKKIQETNKNDELSKWCLENLSFGLDHAELGGLVAERWNFPAELGSIIRYHHDISRCPADNLPLTRIIYFADAAPKIASGEYPVYLLPPEIIEQFKLKNEAEVIQLAKSVI